jgi:GT2 family glycosyltransferase
MRLSAVIPSYGRPEKLRRALTSLASQSDVGGDFEVLVGLDGGTSEEAALIQREFAACSGRIRVYAMPRSGLAAVRNALIRETTGDVMLSLNDDIIASPNLLAEHVRAHDQRRVLVVGAADWKVHSDDTIFDRLIRETSMIFFYASMNTTEARAQPDRDWGFRHAWTINLSMRMDDVRALGGYTVFDSWYGSEDLDMAFRASKLSGGRPVMYRPLAHVIHDHRIGLREYLEREYKLGYNAIHFARASPEAAFATFGRDVAAHAEYEYSLQYVKHEQGSAKRALELMTSVTARTSDQDSWEVLRDSLYAAHLPLKRWCWRSGLIACVEGRPIEDARSIAQWP